MANSNAAGMTRFLDKSQEALWCPALGFQLEVGSALGHVIGYGLEPIKPRSKAQQSSEQQGAS
jgi:hypothetical protein